VRGGARSAAGRWRIAVRRPARAGELATFPSRAIGRIRRARIAGPVHR
jgi:hypothetical protein